MVDKGEVVAPLYLLIKDHKGWSYSEENQAPPSRPVCSGNSGYNRHLSEVVSLVLEPLGHAVGGCDVDSTGDLLAEIDKLNADLRNKEWSNPPASQYPVRAENVTKPLTRPSEDHPRTFGEAFKSFGAELKAKRIATLRKLTQRNSVAPNLKARLWALRIMDELR